MSHDVRKTKNTQYSYGTMKHDELKKRLIEVPYRLLELRPSIEHYEFPFTAELWKIACSCSNTNIWSVTAIVIQMRMPLVSVCF